MQVLVLLLELVADIHANPPRVICAALLPVRLHFIFGELLKVVDLLLKCRNIEYRVHLAQCLENGHALSTRVSIPLAILADFVFAARLNDC